MKTHMNVQSNRVKDMKCTPVKKGLETEEEDKVDVKLNEFLEK